MSSDYTYIADMAGQLPDIPSDSIVSRAVYTDERVKALLFGFAPGQELSEHTSAQPAILHFLQGQARLTLGEKEMRAEPGTWAHMSAHLPHSIYAETQVVMLLLLLRENA